MNVTHRSGLEIDGVIVVSNPVRMESTTLPWNYTFHAEDGETYIYRDLEDTYTSGGGRFVIRRAPERQRWEMKPYTIVHQELGAIGIAAIRLYRPEHSMGIDSDVEFAIFGHVQIEGGFRGRGFGVPTYVAAQTTLPLGYRLAKTNNAKYISRIIWKRLDDPYGLVDSTTVVNSSTGVASPRTFLKGLGNG